MPGTAQVGASESFMDGAGDDAGRQGLACDGGRKCQVFSLCPGFKVRRKPQEPFGGQYGQCCVHLLHAAIPPLRTLVHPMNGCPELLRDWRGAGWPGVSPSSSKLPWSGWRRWGCFLTNFMWGDCFTVSRIKRDLCSWCRVLGDKPSVTGLAPPGRD